MTRNWTFGRKIAAGFAGVVLLALAIGAVGAYALSTVVDSKDRVLTHNAQNLIEAQRIRRLQETRSAAVRGYLLTRTERFAEDTRRAREELLALLGRLEDEAATPQERETVAGLQRAELEYTRAVEQVMGRLGGGLSAEAAGQLFNDVVVPRRDALDALASAFTTREEQAMRAAQAASARTARSAMTALTLIAALALAFAAAAALVLTRTLGRQIGAAVAQVQSSSAELQAAANQQATGAREQATAMSEITTTITELLATSRQIAESAQRVARIAGQTAAAAQTGSGTVERASESIGGIRRQVDQVVHHMLELGRKSQHIGSVVDIVSELAEQTNILAINATIEAAGAGEAGKRFAVVADEIRKLADRVAGSAKEIRGLIDDVRGAVNTTVMATETGSKAVDAGHRQFAEVAQALGQIAGLVSTTTEAAREIELSTKQQATAVEQVNLAIANVAQATRETETSSTQTLQTVSELAGLSRDLLRVTQQQAAA